MNSYIESPASLTSESSAAEPSESRSNDPYVIELSRPYLFEGQEYVNIDMSPLRDASTLVLLKAEKAWTSKSNTSMQMEMTLSYCLEVAAAATDKPISFYERLPKPDGIAVKALVQKDFFGSME